MMKLLVLIALGLFATASMTVAATAEEEAAAIGEKWLALLDNQQYDDSWKQAGAAFRDQVKQDQWVDGLKQSRRPLGSLVSRTAPRVEFAKTLRGAPDGDYCIIHYKTVTDIKTITERLTLVKEDGKWQVSAYAIH